MTIRPAGIRTKPSVPKNEGSPISTIAAPRPSARHASIAALTSIEVSTLSRLVDALERKTLVERRRPATRAAGSDARAVTVHLTEAGRTLTESLIPIALDYETTALDGFSPAEVKLIKAMLQRLFHNMARLDAAERATGRDKTLAAE